MSITNNNLPSSEMPNIPEDVKNNYILMKKEHGDEGNSNKRIKTEGGYIPVGNVEQGTSRSNSNIQQATNTDSNSNIIIKTEEQQASRSIKNEQEKAETVKDTGKVIKTEEQQASRSISSANNTTNIDSDTAALQAEKTVDPKIREYYKKNFVFTHEIQGIEPKQEKIKSMLDHLNLVHNRKPFRMMINGTSLQDVNFSKDISTFYKDNEKTCNRPDENALCNSVKKDLTKVYDAQALELIKLRSFADEATTEYNRLTSELTPEEKQKNVNLINAAIEAKYKKSFSRPYVISNPEKRNSIIYRAFKVQIKHRKT